MEQDQRTREEAFLTAFRNGDDAAFDGLIGMYSAKLYKVAYALLGSRQGTASAWQRRHEPPDRVSPPKSLKRQSFV